MEPLKVVILGEVPSDAEQAVARQAISVQRVGSDALAVAVRESRPHVVLCGGGNGRSLEALRAARAEDPHVAFIQVLASEGEGLDVAEAIGAGVDEVVTPACLGRAIPAALARRRFLARVQERHSASLDLIRLAGVTQAEVCARAVDAAVRLTQSRAGALLLVDGTAVHRVAGDASAAALSRCAHDRLPVLEDGPGGRILAVPVLEGDHVRLVLGVEGAPRHVGDTEAVRLLAETAWHLVQLRRADEEVRRLYRAVEQSPVSVVITDARGGILYVNRSFTEVTGYSRAEVIGQNPRMLKSGQHSPEFYRELWAELGAGRDWRGRLCNRARDGRLFWEEAVISPVPDEGGRVAHYVAVKRDITADMAREEALEASRLHMVQAQRVEDLVHLAGGIAHDFNNLLGVITAAAGLALKGVPPVDATHAKLVQIVRAADEAARLTRQLLAFSRRQVLQPLVLDPSELVRSVASLLRGGPALDVDAPPGVPSVRVDPGEIRQAVLALALRAQEVTPAGGRIRIRTSGVLLAADDLRGHGLMPPGPYVLIEVEDGGPSLSEDERSRLFEPFGSSATPGVGLGLSTVHGTVKQSGGFIWVEVGAGGAGTAMRVYLPAADEPAAIPAAERRAAPGSRTILLVEDNQALRSLMAEVLADAGYEVIEAGDGEAALAVAESHPRPLHLILTDVILPGHSGPEVAAAVALRHPGIRVMFTSGFPADALGPHGVIAPGLAFLPKPATAAALLAKVAEVLSGP